MMIFILCKISLTEQIKYIDKTFNEVQINNKEFDNINNKGTDINLESKEKKQ